MGSTRDLVVSKQKGRFGTGLDAEDSEVWGRESKDVLLPPAPGVTASGQCESSVLVCTGDGSQDCVTYL